jgi:3-hydroxyacyl-CoA dehydrogenase
MDIAGIDVLAHVSRNLADRLDSAADRAVFELPSIVASLVERGWVGSKAGQGFYRKADDGEILTLDPSSMTYRPKQSVRLPSLEAARSIENVGERIRTLVDGQDKVGRFLRATLIPTLEYAERVAPQIAHHRGDIDNAMRWGFGWELGPFETMEALRRSSGSLASARSKNVVKKNAGASLIDLGDGVLGVEFHSKMNAIGGDTIQMLQSGVKEASANFAALVVANDAVNFSAGANLMLLLLEAQEGNWDEVDLMIRAFQSATMSLKYADVPVVAAPAGLALGGGCEIVLHADRVQAAAEAYIGLVEVGVGLIPAGGGTKEMLARAMEAAAPFADPLPLVRAVFETIGFAKVSTSGADARRLGYLRNADGISMNRDRLKEDAKAIALGRVPEYVRPQPRTAIRVGGRSVFAALKLGIHLAWRGGRISEHDALIGRKLAWILAGGDLPAAGTVTEQQVLDLEREAFLSLCGERKTQERIAHTLKTGKPLRN